MSSAIPLPASNGQFMIMRAPPLTMIDSTPLSGAHLSPLGPDEQQPLELITYYPIDLSTSSEEPTTEFCRVNPIPKTLDLSSDSSAQKKFHIAPWDRPPESANDLPTCGSPPAQETNFTAHALTQLHSNDNSIHLTPNEILKLDLGLGHGSYTDVEAYIKSAGMWHKSMCNELSRVLETCGFILIKPPKTHPKVAVLPPSAQTMIGISIDVMCLEGNNFLHSVDECSTWSKAGRIPSKTLTVKYLLSEECTSGVTVHQNLLAATTNTKTTISGIFVSNMVFTWPSGSE